MTIKEKQELLAKLTPQITNDKEIIDFLAKYKITRKQAEANVIFLYRYLERKQRCLNCKNYESCTQPNAKGFVYSISIKNNEWSLELNRCSLKKDFDNKKILLQDKKKHFYIQDFNDKAFFDSYADHEKLLDLTTLKYVKDKLLLSNKFTFIESKYQSKNKIIDLKNLIIQHVIEESVNQNLSACVIDLCMAIQAYRANFSQVKNQPKYAEANLFTYDFNGKIRDCDLLLIFNIDAEINYVPWFHGEILPNLLAYRKNKNLKTICASNSNIQNLYFQKRIDIKNKTYVPQIDGLIKLITE